jgi:putative Mn2+ efflux pump MntP
MLFIDIILTGIGLAMDAMAVSICKGLTMNKIIFKDMIIVALYFGMFQFMMPIFGYIGGFYLASIITKVDNIVAFILLSIIGINMVKEGIVGEGNNVNSDINYKVMFPLAIATSIDAFTVGISFAFLKVNLFFSTIIIGIITFILSLIGIIIGYNFGIRFQKSSLIFGGFALIVIGLKILLYS